MTVRPILLTLGSVVALAIGASGQPAPLVQVQQTFETDPGWEALNNRVVAENPPTITQDFGYSPGRGPAIGGTVTRSRTPAWYGVKVGPFSFDDPLSASGRVVLMPTTRLGGAYFGFFNSTRQEWRPWSSMAVRIADLQSLQPLLADSHVDYMSANWKAGGFTVGMVPADRKPHRWSLRYEPDTTVPTVWEDEPLQRYIGEKRQTEEAILAKAQTAEPKLTMEQLRERLQMASYLGLIEFHTRRGAGWEIRREPEKVKGRITYRFDDGPPLAHFINVSIRHERAVMDRFGIFNFQLPGWPTELYLSDLVVNGSAIDLSHDPGWEGHGNRVQFVETDFHAKQDFGWSRTNFAGIGAGEIGGTFWRTEPVDPLHAYYADDAGALTLEDPVSFSGQICFTRGGTDAGMWFGYFNTKNRVVQFTLDQGGEAGAPMPNTMGMAIEGPTRIGYELSAQICAADREQRGHSSGPIFVPHGQKHRFTFVYDPAGNKGTGRIEITIDGAAHAYNLTPEQRKSGATFDRFGLMNIRRGGKYVTVYFDDLSYTARRVKDYQPVRHKEKVVTVPYPEGGRKY